jgi:sporulation protein YlmC with PRC-barrel domain
VSDDEINLDLLLGRSVVARNGKRIGRVEEFRAESRGHELVITEYHLGPEALLERLSVSGLSLLSLFGIRSRRRGLRIPWDKLDLSNPKKLRLTCSIEELTQLDG